MNLALLLPAGLAALAALVLPLLIHVTRRTEIREIDFAAMRWLRARVSPRRKPRFEEWPLLLLRLLLLAGLAFMLARPVLYGVTDERPVIAVVPGLPERAIPAVEAGVRRVWLADGLPEIKSDAAVPAPPQRVASLLRELDSRLPPGVTLTVIVPAVLQGADAERPRVSRPVDWRIVPDTAMPAPKADIAPPFLAVRHDDTHRGGVRYLRAAATAWAGADGEPRFDAAATDEALPGNGAVIVWLSAEPLPGAVRKRMEEGAAVLVAADTPLPHGDVPAIAVWRDAAAAPLIELRAVGAGRLLRFTRPLEPAEFPELLEGRFAGALRDALAPAPVPARAAASVYTPQRGGETLPQPPLPLHPWLAVGLAVLMLAERWLATSRRRAAAP
jgi:hypothetical protein